MKCRRLLALAEKMKQMRGDKPVKRSSYPSIGLLEKMKRLRGQSKDK